MILATPIIMAQQRKATMMHGSDEDDNHRQEKGSGGGAVVWEIQFPGKDTFPNHDHFNCRVFESKRPHNSSH